MAPIEVGPDQHDITLVIDGTTFIWICGEPIDGTGPVAQRYFTLMAVSQLRDAETLARRDDQIGRLDREIARLDDQIGRLDRQIGRFDRAIARLDG